MKLIVISGGIGSGKSIVSRILQSMGQHVYDCDSRAKQFMDSDKHIIEAIAKQICKEAVTTDGKIDRRRLAEQVFSDPEALKRLNNLVHGAVRIDILRWGQSLACDTAWVETAIAKESGIIDMADEVWHVTAPAELRLKRVMARNGLTAAQVKERMQAQASSHDFGQCGKPVRVIVNDDIQPVLPQILSLLKP